VAEVPARRTGLGRGLQALLPNAGEQPHAPDPTDWLSPVGPDPAPRLTALVESGLDVLQRAVGADICAYVHGRGQGRPRLWLRAGPGAAVPPAEWVELGMAAVGAVLGQVRMPRTVRLGGTELLAVPTRGGTSAGVHLLGCAGRGLTDHERTVAIHLVQALGEALHGLLPERDDTDAPAGAGAAPPLVIERAPARPAVVARWPAPVDLEEIVRDAVRASGVHPSDLDVRLMAEKGTEVIDVAAGHGGDRVRVVLPADPEHPAETAARAALQTVHLLQLIGAEAEAEEQLAG
jgi:hypothetical protein